MYYCYLLRSQQTPTSKATYIGFSTHPEQRLRQHNGEIVAGARKTSRFRPWVHVAIIGGFPNKVVALQFEWQWQHPTKSRIVGNDSKTPTKCGYKHVLSNLSTLLSNRLWKRLNLTVSFANQTYVEEFKALHRHGDMFLVELIDYEKLNQEAKKAVQQPGPPSASICKRCRKSLESSTLWFWSCKQCQSCSHLQCAAREAKTECIIPHVVECSTCTHTCSWSSVVTQAQRYSIIGASEGSALLDASTIGDTNEVLGLSQASATEIVTDNGIPIVGTQDIINLASSSEGDSSDGEDGMELS